MIIGIRVPYIPVWLEERGLDASQIGLVLAAGLFVRLIVTPMVAAAADRRGRARPYLLLLAVGGLLTYAAYLPAYGFWSILFVMMLSSAFTPTLMPLGESATMRLAYKHNLDYGRIRLWGSVAFIVFALLGGPLIEGGHADRVIWLLMFGAVLVFAAALVMPEAGPVEPAAGENGVPRRSPWALLANPAVFCFLAVTTLVHASHAVYYAFATIHWQSAGHSGLVIGTLWSVSVIAEILFFAFSARLVRRVNPVSLMAAGAAASVVRWVLTGLTTDFAALAVIQVLHAVTYGALHLGAMHFIARAVPVRVSGSAQSLYSAIPMGLGLGVAIFAAGPLYAALGGGAFQVMAVGALVALALALLLGRLWRDGELKI